MKNEALEEQLRSPQVHINVGNDDLQRRIQELDFEVRAQREKIGRLTGGTQELFVRLLRARRILAVTDARNVYELEECEAADDVLSFKNNIDYRTMFSLGRQERISFIAGP